MDDHDAIVPADVHLHTGAEGGSEACGVNCPSAGHEELEARSQDFGVALDFACLGADFQDLALVRAEEQSLVVERERSRDDY